MGVVLASNVPMKTLALGIGAFDAVVVTRPLTAPLRIGSGCANDGFGASSLGPSLIASAPIP
jgi:hypothetical protein